ncbi:sensor histidine kinase [Candidatus Methylospira mobilis]|nr:sensor histidine kinase [Candidatus Methylospira mobilis]WNV03176.1 sensor histidine kinase [Candidatus Methylospira mobilis]
MDGKLPLDHPPTDAHFEALKNNISAGYTRDVYWLRFSLRRAADAPTEWWLEIVPAFLDHVDLYEPAGDGYIIRRGGDRIPLGARDVEHKNIVFRLDLADNAPHTYYIRVQTTSTMSLRAALWQPERFFSHSNREYWLFGAFFGAWGIMVLVNLLFFGWLRTQGYAYYCAYLFFDGLGMLSGMGFAGQYLLPNNPLLADYLMGSMICCAIFAVSWMFIALLDLPRHYPRMTKFIKALAVLSLAGIPVVLSGQYSLIAGTLYLFSLVIGVTSLVMAFSLAVQGNRPARWIFYAFSAHLIGVGAITLRNLGFLPTGILADYMVTATTLVHLVLINIGIAVRFKEAVDTRQQAQEIALQAANEIELAQTQQRFAAMIAHELRNPLATIDICLDTLYQLHGEAPQEVFPRYHKIDRARKRISHLIDNFLTSERIKEGRLTLSACGVDLRHMLTDIVDCAQGQSQRHRLRVYAEERLQFITADPELLRIAIDNLVDNAIKYSPVGSDIRLEAVSVEEGVLLTVTDQGRGIPAHDIPLLFEAHYRGTAQGTGAGLGLYLVRQIVELHGGSVNVQSSSGGGSKFTLLLPAWIASSRD